MMTFKGTTKKIKEIANEVNVRYILEGSVRKAGNNLRITAQLIDAQKDGHLWAEKYSGTIEDIFDIQEKVSKSIVESLDIKLSKQESDLVQHPIQDPRTLEYLMRTRYEMLKLTETGLLKAVALAEQGLEIVGENALLYGTMGLANLLLHHYGIRVTQIQLEKAKNQANQSLSLDPECPPAHLVRGICESYIEYNKQAAAHIFKNILEYDKNNPDALRGLGFSYMAAGRIDEARPISIRLLQLDPMTPDSHAFRGWLDMCSGLIQESIPYHEKWLHMDPDGPFPQYWCSLLYAINNEHDKSIELLDSLIKMFPDLIYTKFAFFFKSALKGDKKNTLRYATEELITNAEFLDWLSIGMTLGYAFISEKDEAVKWCRIMLNQGVWNYPLYQKIDVLKDHTGFQEGMDEMKRRSDAFVI
jgi:tetratricopeptide (TPR) repeat protein